MSAEIICEIVERALNIGILIGAVAYVILFRKSIREFSEKNIYPWDKKKEKKNKSAERQRR